MSDSSITLAKYWQKQIALWQQSRLSCVKFCQQYELKYNRFMYWRQKLMPNDIELETEYSGFTQICCEDKPSEDNLELALPNGLVIQNINDHNIALVSSLLAALS